MGRIVRLVLAIVIGIVIGSILNMSLIVAGGKAIAPPPGADVTTVEGLKASIHLFEPKHFVFPFLAHALGTFVAALVAVFLAPGRPAWVPWVPGVVFLAGGIANVAMLPAPLWFDALDLVGAYLPMAWLARRLATPRAAPPPA